MCRTKLSYKSRPAFTIVELLIVVVVIAILAAITIVSYSGITGQAKESTLKSELSTTAKKVGLVHAQTGSYPVEPPEGIPSLVNYSRDPNSANEYCATASSNNKSFYITQDGNIQTGLCPGHSVVVGTMQSFTPAQCSALTTYTGSNESDVIALTDTRGGITRTYQVAKLADDNCWMLNNLKLGSTTATTQLTNQDTNLNNKTSFTLPQILTTSPWDTSTNPGNNYDTPYAYGPVPGDTGSGATNYGYLYNWSATTAGESRTSHPQTAGNAPNDICPKGWRLPTGGLWNATTNEFSNLNARMAGLAGVTDANYTSSNFSSATRAANWRNNGPFKGVFSGLISVNYSGQGSNGTLWSSSAYPSNDNFAFVASFYATGVNPGSSGNFGRNYGLGVRCLLN